AHLFLQKYQNAMPLYRQEAEWAELGLKLSRATMANWVI
ncbi:MAG: transposase, partial [Acidaminococcaceae bacterium]|nr:transposase [Acidaminococcaceae bacterium]